MAADWRRSVAPHASGISAIPMPASTMKKPTNTSREMRMSMAGPAQRGAMLPPPPPMAAPSTNPRHSIFRSSTNNPLLASTSKAAIGRTPMNSANRRGSMWPGAPAAAVASGSQPLKDPRQLRDRNVQNRMRKEVTEWLREIGYPEPNALYNITGKDYRSIFEALVSLIDKNHWAETEQKIRFEDAFIAALKSLRYPFVAQLDVKGLAAPASMHSWPALLGVLHWLVEECKALDYYQQSHHPTLQILEDVPDEFDDPFHHRAIANDYYALTYQAWLEGSDDFTEFDTQVEARYAKKNEKVLADLDTKKEELRKLKKELSQLTSTPAPLVALLAQNESAKSDEKKFAESIRIYTARKQRLIDTIEYERGEVARRTEEYEQLQKELGRLQEIVREQNLSPEEVMRMNTDHESLSRNLEDLKHRISETQKTVMTLEVQVANRAEAAEHAVDTYTNTLSALGLFPPLQSPWEDIDLTLELNTALKDPQALLSGADIRKTVRPTLSAIAESKRLERAEVENEKVKVENELDQLTAECENVQGEIKEMDRKVEVLNEQADDLRTATLEQAQVSQNEADRLERDLAHARNAAIANGMGIKTRLQTLEIAYREQVEKVNKLREETVRAIVKNSNETLLFKEEVSQQLRNLRQFAEEN